MASRQRRVDEGARRGRVIRRQLGEETREARIGAGLSQRALGRLVGISHTHVGRIERGEVPGLSVDLLARILSVLGLELSARAFPAGPPVRDAGHLALLARFRARLPAGLGLTTEVPVRADPHRRVWDGSMEPAGGSVRVEGETRLRDIQATERKIMLKAAQDGSRIILLVSDTRTNRRILGDHQDHLSVNFPLGTREVLSHLRQGRCPPQNGIVVL